MKRITLALALFTLMTSSFTAYAQDKTVALTTFWVSKHIGFEELGGGAGLAAAIGSLSDDPNFNLQPVLDNFYKVFNEDFIPQMPFKLLDEKLVLDNEAYQAYEGRFGEEKDEDRRKIFQAYMTPEGYKPLAESLTSGEKSNQNQMAMMFADQADGVMFVTMGYDFVKKTMPMTAGVRAYIKIKVWDKEGKKAFTFRETSVSKKSVPIVAGIPVMKPEKLLPLCESASEALLNDLNKKMKKITAKAAKNL